MRDRVADLPAISVRTEQHISCFLVMQGGLQTPDSVSSGCGSEPDARAFRESATDHAQQQCAISL